jgi:hypothetical protein
MTEYVAYFFILAWLFWGVVASIETMERIKRYGAEMDFTLWESALALLGSFFFGLFLRYSDLMWLLANHERPMSAVLIEMAAFLFGAACLGATAIRLSGLVQ